MTKRPESGARTTGSMPCAGRGLNDDALAFDVIQPWFAHRLLGDELFELKLQLLEQPWRALGALPVQCAFELLNPQLEKRDQRLLPTAPPVHWQPPPRLAAAPHARPHEAPAGRSQDPMEDHSASIS